jgi:hypothetical protein
MFTLLATWKISCVVDTYIFYARTWARATSRRRQQCLAEAPLEGGG